MTNQEGSFEELEQKLLNHRGETINRELQRLARSGYILKTNYRQLRSHINQYEENWKEVLGTEQRTDGTPYLDEFLRLLHNYVASVNSIYEHVQELVRRKLESKEFEEVYSDLLVKYDIGKTNKFLIDFRHYTQHYAHDFPLPTPRLFLDVTDRMTGEHIKRPQITFTIEELQSGSFTWKSEPKELMEELADDGHIVLIDVIDEFQEEVDNFYNELYDAASEIFKNELIERDRTLVEMHNLRPEEIQLTDEEIESVMEYFDE